MLGLEYLIYHERDLTKINKYLSNHPKILENKNADGNNILMNLIKLYISLDENATSELEYLYNVIIQINNEFSRIIKADIDTYLNIIRDSEITLKPHITKLINLLNGNYYVTLEELEEKYNISFNFTDDIINEAYSFYMRSPERHDFTDQQVITIDSKHTKCIDDALYLEKNIDGTYILYIHITDIPTFVPYDSQVFNNAKIREETLYLEDRNIHMYPEYISENLCSLNTDNKKNVITLVVPVDSDFTIIEDKINIVKGKIKVQKKLTYKEADNLIFNPNSSIISKMLVNLYRISLKRKETNKNKELYREYENIITNKNHHASMKTNISAAANIVHEMMTLLNYLIANYFKENSYPFIYREVFLPNQKELKRQIKTYKKLIDNKVAIDKFLNKIKESYKEGQYIDRPTYHRGLDFPCYSHISSPARRFADSFCEYLIYEFIFNKNIDDRNIYLWQNRIQELIPYLNERKHTNEIFIKQYNYLARKSLIRKK